MSFRESESDGCPWCECMCDLPDDCDCYPGTPCPSCESACEGTIE